MAGVQGERIDKSWIGLRTRTRLSFNSLLNHACIYPSHSFFLTMLEFFQHWGNLYNHAGIFLAMPDFSSRFPIPMAGFLPRAGLFVFISNLSLFNAMQCNAVGVSKNIPLTTEGIICHM